MLQARFFDGISSIPKEVTIIFSAQDLSFEYLDIFGHSNHLSWKTSEIKHEKHTQGKHRKISHKANELVFIELYDQDFTELDNWMKTESVDRHSYALFMNRGLMVGLLAATLAIFPAMYFLALPWLAGYAADNLPLEYEVKMGDEMSKSLLSGMTELKTKSAYADSFASAYSSTLDIPIKIYVVESEELNAFALPGGKIFVYSGLLNACKTKEEFAALLGHEIGHVQLRHTTKAIMRSIIGNIIFSIVLSDFNSVAGVAAEQANRLKDLSYSRELERSADEFSLDLMSKSKLDPNGIIKLFDIFEKEEKKVGVEIPEFLSTHPLTSGRIRHAKEKIATLSKQTAPNQAMELHFKQLKIE